MIRCVLDEDGCIDLHSILRVVNQINQEQAWATCFQLAQLIQRLSPANCVPIESLAQIYLHKDGFIHEKSLLVSSRLSIAQDSNDDDDGDDDDDDEEDDGISGDDEVEILVDDEAHIATAVNHIIPKALAATTLHNPRCNPDTTASFDATITTTTTLNNSTTTTKSTTNATTKTTATLKANTNPTTTTTTTASHLQRERKLVASVGIALFWALDYGIPDDEERKLSQTMECLIVKSQSELSLQELIEVTIQRLSHEIRPKADAHYRNICKSLISDTIELSIFLEKIYTATMVLGDLSLDPHHSHKHHHHLNHHHLHDNDHDDDDHRHHHHSLSELGDFGSLRINDWARLWMQVIRELRQRGRFKQALAVN